MRSETKIQYGIASCHGNVIPDCEKEQRSQQFDQEISKRDSLPQFAQRPRKSVQLTSGIFWYHGISFLHDGQKERRGLLTDRSRGNR